MSTMLEQLLAEGDFERAARSAGAPVPVEQRDGLVAVLRQHIAAGRAEAGQWIPASWFVTATAPVLGADGVTPVLGPDGAPLTYITATQPWAPVGNPAQEYAEAVRKVMCAARGGSGEAVWVSQYSEQVEHGAPDPTTGKRQKVTVRAGVQLRTRIPKSAKVGAEFQALQAQ